MPADFAFRQIETQANGLSTGFPELDKVMATRGHPLGQVTVVGGPGRELDIGSEIGFRPAAISALRMSQFDPMLPPELRQS